MEFQTLGGHCAECNFYDFLPFKCGLCKRVYCQAHRQADQHSCSGEADRRVPCCPVCQQPVPVQHGGDTPDAAMDRHLSQGCRPNAAVVPPLPPCSVAGCTHKSIANHQCRRCQRLVCVTHRMPDAHPCRPPSPVRAPAPVPPAKRGAALLRDLVPAWAAQRSSGAAAPAVRRPKGVDPLDCFELVLYFPPSLRRHPPSETVAIPRKWSVGKALDWICEQFGIENTAIKRNRLVTFDSLTVVPNGMLVRESATPMRRLKDDEAVGMHPDLAEGCILIPEPWLAPAAAVPAAAGISPTYAPSDDACWLARVREERAKIVSCA